MRRGTGTTLACLWLASFGCDGGPPDTRDGGALDAGPATLGEASSHGYAATELGPGHRVVRGRFVQARRFDPDQPPEGYATQFLDRWADELGVERGWLGAPEVQDLGTGLSVVRFPVAIDGVPAPHASVRVHVARRVVTRAVVTLPDPAPPSVVPTVTREGAIETASSMLAGATADARLIVALPARGGIGSSEARLVWEVDVRAGDGELDRVVQVDAQSGEVILRSPRRIAVRDRRIYDSGNGRDLTAATLVYDEDGPVAGVTPDAEAEQAYLNALLMHDYFEGRFERDGATLEAYVHYGHPDLRNAFAQDGKLLFADGFVTEDIFAHEYTHGVIDAETDLVYSGESSAVNEALADVMAMLANRRADWHLGPDDRTQPGFRDLERPSTPTTYAARRQLGVIGPCDATCGVAHCYDAAGLCIPGCVASTCSGGECWEMPSCGNDEGYAHENASILSHAIYLAVRAGAVTEHGQGEALGEERMEQIVYETIRSELGGLMGFQATAEAMIDACQRFAIFEPLFGRGYTHGILVEHCAVLANVFADAGLTEPDVDFDGWRDGDDNCPEVANSDQLDTDGDRQGDACDVDATQRVIDVVVRNDSPRGTGWHLLVGDERPTAETWLEVGEERTFPMPIYVGREVLVRMVDEDGVEDRRWGRHFCTMHPTYFDVHDQTGALPFLRVHHGEGGLYQWFECQLRWPPGE